MTMGIKVELPRPEDVPTGEAWFVRAHGHTWTGRRSNNPDRNFPWTLTRPGEQDREVVEDSKVTLLSRLALETP